MQDQKSLKDDQVREGKDAWPRGTQDYLKGVTANKAMVSDGYIGKLKSYEERLAEESEKIYQQE